VINVADLWQRTLSCRVGLRVYYDVSILDPIWWHVLRVKWALA
jgi:hypothetical protein